MVEPMKYKIYELSVLSLLRYAEEKENGYVTSLGEENTKR